MSNKWLQRALSGLGLLLLGGSAWFLYHELRALDFGKVLADISQLSPLHVLIILAFVAGGYSVILGYDFLAMRFVGAWPGFGRIVFASFVSCAFSNSISLPVINVSGTRLRFYKEWGMSARQIMYLVSFIGLSTWMGLLVLTGLACVWHPPQVPGGSPVPDLVIRGLGVLFLAVVAAAIALCATRHTLQVGRWSIRLPSLGLSLGQLTIGIADWTFQAVIFYLVLNITHLPLAVFLPAYFAAMLMAMLAHLPAGLGVFDVGIIVLLSPTAGKEKLVSALVLYRLFYHLLPLAIATILFGAHELYVRVSDADGPSSKHSASQ